MITTTLSRKNMALEVREELRKKVEDIKSRDPTFKPALVIVQVGGREDSNVYIRMKLKAAEEIGISASCLKLGRDTTESQLLEKIMDLNKDTTESQ